MMDEAMEATERLVRAEALKPAVRLITLLGREIPVLAAPDGTPRANEKGKPMAAAGVRSYIARAFGDRLYEKFRPEVPKGAEGWGAKGIPHLERMRSARRV